MPAKGTGQRIGGRLHGNGATKLLPLTINRLEARQTHDPAAAAVPKIETKAKTIPKAREAELLKTRSPYPTLLMVTAQK